MLAGLRNRLDAMRENAQGGTRSEPRGQPEKNSNNEKAETEENEKKNGNEPPPKRQGQRQPSALRKLFLWFMFLFAVCGFAWQMLTVFWNFFKFEVVTEMNIGIDDSVSIPGLTFCVSGSNQLNVTGFIEKYPEAISKISNLTSSGDFGSFIQTSRANWINVIDEIGSMISFESIAALTIPIESFILKSSTVLKKDGKGYEPLYDNCKVKPLYERYSVCYQIICDREITGKNLLKAGENAKLLKIDLNRNDKQSNPSYSISLHTSSVEIRQVSSQLTLSSNIPTEFDVTYRKFEAKLEPFPYTTNCVNYTDDGFADRREKINQCISKKLISKFNTIQTGYLIEPKPDVNLGPKPDDKQAYLDKWSELSHDCVDDARQPDCLKYKLIPTKEEVIIPEKTDRITITAPSEPSITVDYQPKIKMVDFTVYLGSGLVTWFGFCVARDLPTLILAIVDWLSDKFCNNCCCNLLSKLMCCCSGKSSSDGNGGGGNELSMGSMINALRQEDK